MSNFEQQLSDKLKGLGATEADLTVALHGQTKEQKLSSLNVYLAAHAKNNEKINTLRSFTAKGEDEEILECVDQAAKALTKYVFGQH